MYTFASVGHIVNVHITYGYHFNLINGFKDLIEGKSDFEAINKD